MSSQLIDNMNLVLLKRLKFRNLKRAGEMTMVKTITYYNTQIDTTKTKLI